MYLPEHGPGQLIIGVSIEVPQPWASLVRQTRRKAGDPWADEIPPHITLVGPTVIEDQAVEDLYSHLDAVTSTVQAFPIHLQGTDTFRPLSPVVFVAVEEGSQECGRLEAVARSGPLAQDVRFPYHPHVTIAHDVPDQAMDRAADELASFDARFTVSHIWVYEFYDNNVWRKRKRFALRGQ